MRRVYCRSLMFALRSISLVWFATYRDFSLPIVGVATGSNGRRVFGLEISDQGSLFAGICRRSFRAQTRCLLFTTYHQRQQFFTGLAVNLSSPSHLLVREPQGSRARLRMRCWSK
jgi:hypothetical protein